MGRGPRHLPVLRINEFDAINKSLWWRTTRVRAVDTAISVKGDFLVICSSGTIRVNLEAFKGLAPGEPEIEARWQPHNNPNGADDWRFLRVDAPRLVELMEHFGVLKTLEERGRL